MPFVKCLQSWVGTFYVLLLLINIPVSYLWYYIEFWYPDNYKQVLYQSHNLIRFQIFIFMV